MTRPKRVEWFRYLDWALDIQVGSPRTKLVLIVMARRGNRSGYCFMSQKSIAHEANCSIKSVERAIKELKGRDLLMEIKEVHRSRRTKTYKLCIRDDDVGQTDEADATK